MKTIASESDLLHLHRYLDFLQEDEWEKCAALWTKETYTKGNILTREGETEHFLYLVLDGVQRIYRTHEDGREATVIFTYPCSFSGVIDSALTETPSRYYFETLSESTCLKAPIDKFVLLSREIPTLAQFINRALAENIRGLLERLVEMQSLKSEEKFKLFMKRSPHMLHRVPQRYLANYLGIDPSNFSKLLNSVTI